MLIALAWILAICLIVVGLVGILAPALPGPAFVYLGIVIVAWAHGFERISVLMVVLYGLLTVGLLLVDYVASAVGTKRYGGSKWGVGGAMVGALVGMFFLPLGIVVGPLVGAICAELLAGREKEEAARAGFGAFLGFLGGTVVKYLVCFTMLLAALLDHFI